MRIGIVNDLPLAREALRRAVAADTTHNVAWLANNGAEAVAAARRDPVDLVLMDLIMPGIDGVEATRRIMAEAPCPILVVTATVSGNVGKVYEAMGLGALDAVDTPTLGTTGDVRGAAALLSKIATIGKLTGKAGSKIAPQRLGPTVTRSRVPGTPLVAIGSSTGGPNALAEILSALPKTWNATTVIIQHVDSAFASGLARWLREKSGHDVVIAAEDARPEPGRVYLAATNDHLILKTTARFTYTIEPRELNFRPSIDVFFHSVAASWPSGGVAVLLTGMGRDGAAGLLRLRLNGWPTIAQDEATSVVYGMPRAAAEVGAAEQILPLSAIGSAIASLVSNPP